MHTAHLGIVKTKLLAQDRIYWPKINQEIENVIALCQVCQHHQNRQSKEPLISPPKPSRPWTEIASDLFHHNNSEYLLITDIHSGFPFIRKLSTTTSRSIINALKNLFAEHGIPEILRSDNGPQYSSEEFRIFTIDWKFQHTTSSPHYPQSNGFIERSVQTVKKILSKTKDPEKALLIFRTTPVTPINHHQRKRYINVIFETQSQSYPKPQT